MLVCVVLCCVVLVGWLVGWWCCVYCRLGSLASVSGKSRPPPMLRQCHAPASRAAALPAPCCGGSAPLNAPLFGGGVGRVCVGGEG